MPSKLILNLHEVPHFSEIMLQEEGADPVKLNRVKRVILTADAEDPTTVELHMFSPDFQGEVLVSDLTAEAIVLHERQRALSFLDDADVYALRRWHDLGANRHGDPCAPDVVVALDKLIAELAKREPSSF